MCKSGMSGFRRVMAAINRTGPDRVPRGELVVNGQFINDFMRVFGGDYNGKSSPASSGAEKVELEIDFYRLLGLDLVCIPAGDFKQDQAFTHYISRLKEQGLFIFSLVDGAFQTVMNRMGFMDFCVGVASQPVQVGGEIRGYSPKLPQLFELAAQMGAHGIIIADDIAYNQGTYVSPDFIETHLLPCWRDQVGAAKRLGMPVFYHSDGNIGAVLPHIAEAGFEGLQCIDPSAGMDVKKVREEYGKNFCIMGNIDPGLLQPDNEASSLIQGHLDRAVEELIGSFGAGGGLVFGTSSGLYAGLSPEKVFRMYEMAGR